MAAAQIVGLRFAELVENGLFHELEPYLDDNVVVSTWNGVVYGKEKAFMFFEDNRRYMHHKQNYNRWRQVHHCLDPNLVAMHEDQTSVVAEDRLERSGRLMTGRMRGGDPEVSKFFDANGYDSQGYAMFEREGTYGSHPKFAFSNLPVRQVVVVRRGLVVLYQLSMRR